MQGGRVERGGGLHLWAEEGQNLTCYSFCQGRTHIRKVFLKKYSPGHPCHSSGHSKNRFVIVIVNITLVTQFVIVFVQVTLVTRVVGEAGGSGECSKEWREGIFLFFFFSIIFS